MLSPRELLRGAWSGAIAVVPMTAVFWIARWMHLLDEVPPHKAIRSVAPGQPEPQLTVVSALAHTGVGAAAGAAYSGVVPLTWRGAATGALFGLAVWALGYELVMPVATDIAPAHRDRRDRAIVILAAHLVYGAVLGRRARLS